MRRRPRASAQRAADLAPFLHESYINKVLKTEGASLVGFWPQNEQGGAVSFDKSPHFHDGAYTTATPGAAGIVPGLNAVSFDGTNDYNDIYTAGLANDNLLANPGFETAGVGGDDVWANWTETKGDGALANEAGAPHEGSDAAKATSGATSNTKVAQTITTVAGKRYRLRFYSKDDGTNAGRYGIYDVSGSADIVAVTATAIAAAYAATVVEFVAPATSTRIDLWCPAVNTKIVYFDACEVRSMDGFLGDEGTLLAWAKVSGVGVWTDGTQNNIAAFVVDGSNYLAIYKSTGNNAVTYAYNAGGTWDPGAKGSLTTTDWMCFAMSWSNSGDAMKSYYAGTQSGATATSLGTWLGDLGSGSTIIGAANDTPTSPWSGPIGPVALWNKALTADQIAYLSKV